ncbi:MAG TPA: ATP-binding cassette domain-containing protein, partial [Mobilitalea sp.]|nr:ATP-binding cassette domain-containing protein [Mobilitalea sp.]
ENEKRKKEIDKLNDAAKRMAGWSDKLEGSKIGTGAPDRGYIGHKAAKLMKRSKAIETRRNNSVEEKTKLLKNIETADDLMILPLPYYKDTLLEVKVLSVKYDGKTAVSGINFKLEQGDRLALCGKNGSGKSSILKLILGEKLEYDGYVNIGSYLVMSYISQEASNLIGSIKDFSRNENIDESLLMAILRKLDFSRVQFEKDMKDYSGGQKKKVLLAASLCHRAHLYVWDEPLNYIDIISRMQIEELILKFQPTMIFVEHDSAFLDHIATKRVEL